MRNVIFYPILSVGIALFARRARIRRPHAHLPLIQSAANVAHVFQDIPSRLLSALRLSIPFAKFAARVTAIAMPVPLARHSMIQFARH